MRGALAHDPGHPRTMRISTLRGIAQLATEATLGVARVVEGVHAGVLRTVRELVDAGCGRPQPPRAVGRARQKASVAMTP